MLLTVLPECFTNVCFSLEPQMNNLEALLTYTRSYLAENARKKPLPLFLAAPYEMLLTDFFFPKILHA